MLVCDRFFRSNNPKYKVDQHTSATCKGKDDESKTEQQRIRVEVFSKASGDARDFAVNEATV